MSAGCVVRSFASMTTTRRVTTSLIAAAALLPASAQAMPAPGPIVHKPQSAPQPVVVEPASPADGTFDWGSAELGGMSVALLLAAGAGSTLLVRRRRAHAPLAG